MTVRATRLRAALALIAARNEPAAAEVRSRLYAALAAAYMLDRRLDEAIEVGTSAAGNADDGAVDEATRCNLDAILGSVLVFAGQLDQGWGRLETAIASAKGAGLEAEAARGYRMLATSASVLVDYDRALH